MNIELRNVKMVTRMSEETICFVASVYIDGTREGEVSNDGKGGCHRYSLRTLEDKLAAHAKTFPPEPNPYHPGQVRYKSADELIDEALEVHLNRENFKRFTRTKTAARLPGQTYGKGQWTMFARVFSPEIKAQVIAKYGAGTVFLNENEALMDT